MTQSPSEIAEQLSDAQRRWLTTKSVKRFSVVAHKVVWTAYPPPNTHAVLVRLGLVNYHGLITDTGLAVRKHLEQTNAR